MPAIHVCSLARLPATVRDVGASHVATLINVGTPVERPASIAAERHLMLAMSDITAPLDGHILPEAEHVERLIAFMRGWGGAREQPMVVHCYAGVSRSTAAAFIGACALTPDMSELDWAYRIRDRSPTATPNERLVRLADDLLGRRGRMVDAIRRIGRGSDCFEGVSFRLDLGPAQNSDP